MSRHESVWAATAQTPFCAPLGENIHVQVCVVGGGIAGLTTADCYGKVINGPANRDLASAERTENKRAA